MQPSSSSLAAQCSGVSPPSGLARSHLNLRCACVRVGDVPLHVRGCVHAWTTCDVAGGVGVRVRVRALLRHYVRVRLRVSARAHTSAQYIRMPLQHASHQGTLHMPQHTPHMP